MRGVDAGRVDRFFDAAIDFIPNESFVGRRDSADELSPLAEQVETNGRGAEGAGSAGLPAHLSRICSTPLLTPDEEQELFRRMNFCKHRAAAIRSRLSRSNPDPEKLAEAEDYLQRSERLRNYLIRANTRLVMSIARKFADSRNGFDDLLSQGLASLMHSVEKFDYSRGYRFSTYATCAVRRDLYRMVMNRKKHAQRFATGTDELLSACPETERDPDEMTEAGWKRLSQSLHEMLGELDERERFILTHRFGLDGSGARASYSRLGERLGISKERVRQLANRALDKLREIVPEYRLEGLVS
ncbi:sigma-70 family RNA polymerase sigma factor [Botrimarina sp.]|uniref:sigma-70 family RNA polymerase sigma factor n=1 Tax=Botrimarina sp. TaxID=2795802 RepID=UPI0032EB2919